VARRDSITTRPLVDRLFEWATDRFGADGFVAFDHETDQADEVLELFPNHPVDKGIQELESLTGIETAHPFFWLH
jgi:methylase of polypeptide subunit release factors